MDNRPIGMFDSGVGGMTVFLEVMKNFPNEHIIYLGDTKRFPYGSKSKETIIELSKKAIDFLISKNVKIIIIACGTATSQALEEVRKIYKIPILQLSLQQ
jgi:glutamate racemase